ncbi:ATP-binding protein [Deinococcus lacus]|uniref:histidine kinase n=1 Tax=Deinococcus lacus TaxID=392561 RepID=A0ABW1YAI3_9DEIO
MAALISSGLARTVQTGEAVVLERHPLLHSVGVSAGVLLPLFGHDQTVRGILGLAYRGEVGDRDYLLAEQLAGRFGIALDNALLRDRVARAQRDLQQLNQSLEDRVAQRTRDLEEANRELEAFSYSVSHDLRTPLRHMAGFSDLLGKELRRSGEPPAKVTRYLKVMAEAADRMNTLIDDLLEFSRMGRQEMRRGDVDLGTLIMGVWRDLELDRQGRTVELRVKQLPNVPGDANLLRQVFMNLLSNALKYSRTREVAYIEVWAEVRAEQADILVRDNGVGFDARYTDKLFGVFQRLHRAEEFEGTGIGLANVRRIVARHGGHVSAESELGAWALFRVTLPLRGED